ncbi:hypothetical protein [Kribbella sp. NBC_00359]|uniref:hypothetical protein n=1 Tax=Kribbella sp. NBC_00359 TaxID=2975966 RepID=UPI002E1F5617
MTTPDTSAVERAFAVVAGTQADLYDRQTALEEHTSELSYQPRLFGMHLHRAGERVDQKLVHQLYWEPVVVDAGPRAAIADWSSAAHRSRVGATCAPVPPRSGDLVDNNSRELLRVSVCGGFGQLAAQKRSVR